MAIQPATTDTTISSAANPVHSFDRCIAAHFTRLRSAAMACIGRRVSPQARSDAPTRDGNMGVTT
jgi:hypothetical protein